MSTEIDVLMPAYNEQNLIGRAIRSVASQRTNAKLNVLIIANGCIDETAQRAKDVVEELSGNSPHSFTIYELAERGKANALNYGLAKCSSDIVLTIDTDVRLEPDCIQLVLNSFSDTNTWVSGVSYCFDPISLSDQLLSYVQHTDQIHKNIIRRKLSPTGSMLGFRRTLIDCYPRDVLVEDSWVSAIAAQRYGWGSVKVIYDAECYVVACQNWNDLILRMSRGAYGTTYLSKKFPELAPVIDEGRFIRGLTGLSENEADALTRQEMAIIGIPDYGFDCLKMLWTLCRENGELLAKESFFSKGLWPPALSTKKLPRFSSPAIVDKMKALTQ